MSNTADQSHEATSVKQSLDFWQPTLVGEKVILRPLVESDFEALFKAASDPRIWENHSATDRHQRGPFEKFFKGAMECGGALAILNRDTGELIGSSRYYEWSEESGTVVIGYTFVTREWWGTGLNFQIKKLMLDHAFKRVHTVIFQVSRKNLLSQKALLKLGAVYSHEEEVQVAGVLSSRMIFKMERERWEEILRLKEQPVVPEAAPLNSADRMGRTKPILFKLGVLLIVLSFVPWLLIPVVAWISPTTGEKAAQTGFLILSGEIMFWMGTLFAGREVWSSAKQAGWRKLIPTLLDRLR